MRDDMIVRLARVLAAERGHPHSERHYRDLARRLLAAMREPTMRMEQAVPGSYRPGSHSLREIWNGMIDGALGPPCDAAPLAGVRPARGGALRRTPPAATRAAAAPASASSPTR